MSGHRRVKNVGYDDDDDYDDFDEYEEEVGAGDGAETGDGLTEDDRRQLEEGTIKVRAALGESSEVSDKAIRDALWHYYYDIDKTVIYLKNDNQPKPQAKQPKAGSRFDEAASASAAKAPVPVTTNGKKSDTKKNDSKDTSKVTKGVDGLSLSQTIAAAPARIKSKNLNVAIEYETSEPKRELSFVVVGHIDHGKSTLMGRLLYEHKVIDQRSLDKYRREAAKIGKESFALAWVMDAREDEREHGVTIDYAEKTFSTPATDFTILDAPGHRDFVGNMIAGTSMADFGLLVVDAGTNSFAAGLKGQTREHAQVLRCMKLERIIVAINKMDSVSWSEESFNTVRQQTTTFLEETLFSAADITFVPVSGLTGENILSSPPQAKWYTGPTLVQALDTIQPRREQYLGPITAPLRLRIAGFSGLSEWAEFLGPAGANEPFTAHGRIDAGSVQVGDRIVALPSGEKAVVKGITRRGNTVDWAVAGSIVGLQLVECDEERFNKGDLICDLARPAKIGALVTLKVLAFETVFPMPVDVHRGRMRAQGNVVEMVALLDGQGKVVREKPKVVKHGEVARVKVEMEELNALEYGTRVVLRYGGETVAAGAVERVEQVV